MASWPPHWQAPGHDNGQIEGEVGILEHVSMNDLIANKIFLSMLHQQDRYISVLAFDDSTFCRQLYSLLLENIGRSIREIGDLDVSHLL